MEKRYLFFLGNHPLLAASEALNVLKNQGYSPTVELFFEQLLFVTTSREIPAEFIDQLGGTDRIAAVTAKFEHQPTIEDLAALLSPTLDSNRKANIGISAPTLTTKAITALGQALKNYLKDSGFRIRFIAPNNATGRLNAAAVEFNKLTQKPHRELSIIEHNNRYIVTETITVQDIASYERRDTQRPGRDPKVGMLPPKLAQIMLNLARSHAALHHQDLSSIRGNAEQRSEAHETSASRSSAGGNEGVNQRLVMWDPFCGTGTLIQEGWLMDQTMIGSDAEPRMINLTKKNLKWLQQHFNLDATLEPKLFGHNAAAPAPDFYKGKIDAIVAEPYLGEPIKGPLAPKDAHKRLLELSRLYRSVLQAVKPALKPNGVILLALPYFTDRSLRPSVADRTRRTMADISFLDEVSKLGYREEHLIPEELQEDPETPLYYARPDAFVGREITLWRKV